MAKTKSRKAREHAKRNTGRDATLFRGMTDFETYERKTKTKRDQLNSAERKHKKRFQNGDYTDGIAFLIA